MILLIDKPKGITSHDVVNIVRRKTGERRVGHAGTLDPNATGLLIVAVGREDTKKLGDLTKNTSKEYLAEITLGEERDTDDPEGKVVVKNDQIIPTESEISKVLAEFNGKIEQIPPSYSAIKINGKKSYDLARSGKSFKLKTREVTIYSISDVQYSYPILKCRLLVSSGTYIRSIARDLGKKLGTGGYLSNLRRTKIGQYKVEDANMSIFA